MVKSIRNISSKQVSRALHVNFGMPARDIEQACVFKLFISFSSYIVIDRETDMY